MSLTTAVTEVLIDARPKKWITERQQYWLDHIKAVEAFVGNLMSRASALSRLDQAPIGSVFICTAIS